MTSLLGQIFFRGIPPSRLSIDVDLLGSKSCLTAFFSFQRILCVLWWVHSCTESSQHVPLRSHLFYRTEIVLLALLRCRWYIRTFTDLCVALWSIKERQGSCSKWFFSQDLFPAKCTELLHSLFHHIEAFHSEGLTYSSGKKWFRRSSIALKKVHGQKKCCFTTVKMGNCQNVLFQCLKINNRHKLWRPHHRSEST